MSLINDYTAEILTDQRERDFAELAHRDPHARRRINRQGTWWQRVLYGRSVTGLDYGAWPEGPLPPKLNREIKLGLKQDMAARARFDEKPKDDDTKFIKVTYLGGHSDLKVFSRREKDIMDALVTRFELLTAAQMSKVSHAPGQPWDIVWQGGKGKKKPARQPAVPR